MKEARCTSCGATIDVNERSDCGICPYCNSAYITEKAIKNVTATTNNATTIINNYFASAPQPQSSSKGAYIIAPPRPKINIFLAILGLWFYIFPGVIYINSIKKKQRRWDKNYGGK